MRHRRSPSTEQSEQRLVAGMARGEISALERLYSLYRGRIGRFVSRMGCPEDEHDAICNEVMLVAWDKAASYNPSASRVSTWLFGIARFKGLKLLEQSYRRDRPTGQDFDIIESPEQTEQQLSRTQWLEIAMAALPVEQRQVVELTFFEGLSYREIAQLAGCPENTVKTRMFHARRKLRQLLDKAASPVMDTTDDETAINETDNTGTKHE